MSDRSCKDDKGVIYDIVEGDTAIRFDGVEVTVLSVNFDHSGCFFEYYDKEEKRNVWDYARSFKWDEKKIQ